MTAQPVLYFFGPLTQSGHFLFRDDGSEVYTYDREGIGCPWKINDIDGTLQPGMTLWREHWVQRGNWQQGEAVIHHKDGWTALSFWDSTVDTRPGCSSTYLIKGILTFDEMVALAQTRFAERWGKMQFAVRLGRNTPN